MATYIDYHSPVYCNVDEEAINDAIKNILLTRKGSLPGRPDFGSRVYDVLFEPLDFATEKVLKDLIKEAIQEWESRLKIMDVEIESDPAYNRIIATIYYKYADEGFVMNSETAVSFTKAS